MFVCECKEILFQNGGLIKQEQGMIWMLLLFLMRFYSVFLKPKEKHYENFQNVWFTKVEKVWNLCGFFSKLSSLTFVFGVDSIIGSEKKFATKTE